MTCTSGEPTAETPSKLFAVGLPKRLTRWICRPSDDPQYKWAAKVMVVTPELKQWLDERGGEWETYVQRAKKRQTQDGEKNSYRLAVRSYDRRLLALLALHWRIPATLISSTWKSSSSGKLKASERSPSSRQKSGNGSQTGGLPTPSTYVRNGRQKQARSRYFASLRRSYSN